jgi:hypothetical protein
VRSSDCVRWAVRTARSDDGVEQPDLEKLAHNAELTVGVLEEYRARRSGAT